MNIICTCVGCIPLCARTGTEYTIGDERHSSPGFFQPLQLRHVERLLLPWSAVCYPPCLLPWLPLQCSSKISSVTAVLPCRDLGSHEDLFSWPRGCEGLRTLRWINLARGSRWNEPQASEKAELHVGLSRSKSDERKRPRRKSIDGPHSETGDRGKSTTGIVGTNRG
jgi:hypothetical protein